MIALIDVNARLAGPDLRFPWLRGHQNQFLVAIYAARPTPLPSSYRLRDLGDGWAWVRPFATRQEAEAEITTLTLGIDQPQASGLSEEIVAEKVTS